MKFAFFILKSFISILLLVGFAYACGAAYSYFAYGESDPDEAPRWVDDLYHYVLREDEDDKKEEAYDPLIIFR